MGQRPCSEPARSCSTVLASSTESWSVSMAAEAVGLSRRCSPHSTTTVCARCTPACRRLCTLSTGPTRNTVFAASKVSTTLNGGALLDSTMTGWWLGRKGCRSVRKNATTCCQAAPLATTSVTSEGSPRNSCASLASRVRMNSFMGSSFSSSPKSEFSLTALGILCTALERLLVVDAVEAMRVTRALQGPSAPRLSACLRLLSRWVRLRMEPTVWVPWSASSRCCRNSMRQSTEVTANLQHTCLLQAMAMTTCPALRRPSKFKARQPWCCTAMMRAQPSDSSYTLATASLNCRPTRAAPTTKP
mmetsp:Transcript_66247/g.213526  ORF Transcript_66247/g.213526 Transcript_66247/m.213526 type:complete len:303 (+) Transcript_66247:1388-2296(+)